MSNLPNFPTIRPSLLLDFANSQQVDPRISFTRASTATYFDAQGVLRIAASGVPRIDHDPTTGECKGLLIEERRTNLLNYSEQFDDTTWAKISGGEVVSNVAVSPSGGLAADILRVGSSSTFPSIQQSPSATVSNAHTFSLYIKAAGIGFAQIRLRDAATASTNYIRTIVNLTDGTHYDTRGFGNGSVISASSQSVGNGWFRVDLSGIANTSGTTMQVVVFLSLDSSGTVPTSSNSPATSGIYIWGAQLEAGSFPTSYIPTSSSAATRAADAASMSGTNFSEWYRQDEYTLVAESSSYSPEANFRTVVAIASSNSVSIGRHLTNSRGFGPSASIDCGAGTYPPNAVVKQALAARVNDFALSANGGSIFADTTTGAMPNDANALWIGSTNVTAGLLGGHIRRIACYTKRLSNAELQALTA